VKENKYRNKYKYLHPRSDNVAKVVVCFQWYPFVGACARLSVNATTLEPSEVSS